jgi:hypothetical protein
MSIDHVKESLKAKIPKAEDLVVKELHAGGKNLEVMYFKTISDEAQLQIYLIKPFFEISATNQFLAYLQSHPKVKSFESEEKVQEEGFGLHYRSRHMGNDDWKTWQRLYPTIKFKVNADINISDTGLVE